VLWFFLSLDRNEKAFQIAITAKIVNRILLIKPILLRSA